MSLVYFSFIFLLFHLLKADQFRDGQPGWQNYDLLMRSQNQKNFQPPRPECPKETGIMSHLGILSHPGIFRSFLHGGQHFIIAIGSEEGERLIATEIDRKPVVKIRKPSKTREPDPNEVWLLEPCECGMSVHNTFRIRHVQTGKYLAATSEIHNTLYHGVTLIDDNGSKTSPKLNDFKSYWMINVQGAFFRNIYYDEYLIRHPISKATKVPHKGNQKSSTEVLTGPKPTKESFWVTVLKSRLLLTKPKDPEEEDGDEDEDEDKYKKMGPINPVGIPMNMPLVVQQKQEGEKEGEDDEDEEEEQETTDYE